MILVAEKVVPAAEADVSVAETVASAAQTIALATFAHGYVFLGEGVNSFEAELAGAEGLVQSLLHILGAPGTCGDAALCIHSFGNV